ncbi:hypothetical protein F5148DRAFT_1287118 [Russula earlei]|uniref:Uncharacterized protein n=1 Tax=Russula earlei TaxID=71964 RepID=A0ACC0U2K7_9AGAM|nr:hypothetical protein F5148DRAFT_1287118 [Russula earlei]
MKHPFNLFLALVYAASSATCIQAQNAPAPEPKLKLFFEKVYLHTDREYYVAGDDIWYKAYLVNAQSNYPTFTSNNLYVDVISPNATIVSSEVIRLEKGTGNGDFKLPDTLSEGTYHIRAYTNWMRNFGDNFIYDRAITIGSKTAVPNKPVTHTATKNHYRLQFYPEGGSLLENTPSVVAFKAEDINGKGVMVQGSIINSKGKTVATFNSTHLGIGKLVFTPEAGESYDVKALVNNTVPVSADFPLALEKSYLLSVNNTDTAFLQASINTNKATLTSYSNTLLYIKVRHTGRLCFEDSIHLSTEHAVIRIPKNIIPQGIAVVTLYDEKMRPNSERLVFVDQHSTTDLSLQLDKPSYSIQDNTSLNISTNEMSGSPAKANLSMAVVDATLVPVPHTNIVDYLLLQSELKGAIEQPEQYFDPHNPDRQAQLDMLLLTQGWRDFIWLRLTQQSINIKYLPEAGITFSGRVRRTFADKPLSNMNVTLFAPQAQGTKLFPSRSDSAGRYYIDGVNITGTQRIKIVSKDDKGEKGGYLLLDPLFNNPLAATATPLFENIDTSLLFKQFASKTAERMEAFQKLKNAEYNQLPGVVVTSEEKTQVTRSGEALVRFGYKDSIFNVVPSDFKDYETLQSYLAHKMPGAYTDVETNGLYFISNYPKFHKTYPRFFVDNREDAFGRQDYYSLSMDNLSRVTIKHLLSTNGNDVYQIYLTLKPGANINGAASPELITTEVVGYYEARLFYVPQPSAATMGKNYLTTLDWQPVIQTNANGAAKVTINNRGIKAKWCIIVEGITETVAGLLAGAAAHSQTPPAYTVDTLIYSTGFTNAGDMHDWIVEKSPADSERVIIQNNQLLLDTYGGATVWYKQELQGNILISFKRKVVMQGGRNDRLSDFNQFWMATDPLQHKLFKRKGAFNEYDSLSMYYIGMGGNYNTTTRFRNPIKNTR